jgi:hypothetical protein
MMLLELLQNFNLCVFFYMETQAKNLEILINMPLCRNADSVYDIPLKVTLQTNMLSPW